MPQVLRSRQVYIVQHLLNYAAISIITDYPACPYRLCATGATSSISVGTLLLYKVYDKYDTTTTTLYYNSIYYSIYYSIYMLYVHLASI